MIRVFRESNVFENVLANQLCDQLATVLKGTENYPVDFILTGSAAYALQTDENIEVKNIVFKVTTEKSYFLLIDYIKAQPFLEVFIYDSRIYFKVKAGFMLLNVMIMYDENTVETLVVKNVLIENKNNINPELL